MRLCLALDDAATIYSIVLKHFCRPTFPVAPHGRLAATNQTEFSFFFLAVTIVPATLV